MPKEMDPRILGRVTEFIASLDNYEQAYESCLNAVRNNPDDTNALNRLGLFFEDQGDLYAASYCYTRALSLRREFPEAEFNLVCVRQRMLGETL
jgi:tetratricopeptide (TPR) repeat protein